jgi:hypothetical protein
LFHKNNKIVSQSTFWFVKQFHALYQTMNYQDQFNPRVGLLQNQQLQNQQMAFQNQFQGLSVNQAQGLNQVPSISQQASQQLPPQLIGQQTRSQGPSQVSSQGPNQVQYNPYQQPVGPMTSQYAPPKIFPDFDPGTAVTHPTEKVSVPEHTFVIDSRQRDCSVYPSPSHYRIDLGIIYKNITSIELKGSVIPRGSYNVHSTNKYIDFSIGSTITKINIDNGGTGYTNPTVFIAGPASGVQATATAFTNAYGVITNVVIAVAGFGYNAANPPVVEVRDPTGIGAQLSAVVGTAYTAELRDGQYTIGGNPTPPGTTPTNLLLEIQNAMNYAVNGAPYDPASTGPFEVRLVNQYPTLDAIIGTPEYYNTNSCQFNRIQITNVNSDYWALLFCSGPHERTNASHVMGFLNIDYADPALTLPVVTGSGTLMNGGTSLRASGDYDLYDDPKYVLLSFYAGSDTFERIQCKDASIDRKFGTMVFDANYPNVLTDTVGTTFTTGTSSYLVGSLAKGPFYNQPGMLKPLKGFDFDQKKLEFSPAIGKLGSLEIKFTKFSSDSNDEQEFYDFQGRDHLLIFSVKSNDTKNSMRGA